MANQEDLALPFPVRFSPDGPEGWMAQPDQPLDHAELLNGELFYTLREAQILIEQWRIHYNTVRPHSALGYRPPAPESIVPMDQRPTMH
jgi:transposase InsO family protein